MFVLRIFPESGLDRSLHAPVLIGLCVLTFFAETLGWTYAGLVVPGYLAAVVVIAPVTAALVVFEALATYFLTAIVGLWLPRTGVWSSAFGRERFFLFIVVAILVRLAVEGNLVPFLATRHALSHSRELYSVGLVLVPLLANAFWNGGLGATAPRLAFTTLVTFVVVKFVLLDHTNFTVSRFSIANEAVSLQFLESPHAHIILVLGALIAARSNVLYGWDFNGILVPALLAVAWYQPVKLLTTLLEAVLVYWLARALAEREPLRRFLIVGSRRMLLVFLVGFGLKLVLGFAFARFLPTVQTVDYFGFGYLLPSLLAVKMWSKQRIGTILMPTLQVSLLGFVVGNAVGFGLTLVEARIAGAAPADAERPELGRPVASELLLADSGQNPESRELGDGAKAAHAALEAALALERGELARARWLAARGGLALSRDAGRPDWFSIVARATDPDRDRLAPRLAWRVPSPGRQNWLIVARTERVGSPAPAVAYAVAEALGARALVLRSRLDGVAAYDESFAQSLATRLDVQRSLVIETSAPRSALVVVGRAPAGLDLGALARALDTPLALEFRAAGSGLLGEAPRLELGQAAAERIAARVLGIDELEHWPGGVERGLAARGPELARAGTHGYVAPSIEELRVASATLWPALLAARDGRAPGVWQRAVAGELGYRFARSDDGWLLFEPSGDARRGHASLAVRQRTSSLPRGALVVEVPTPLWERGTLGAGLGIYSALRGDFFLSAGAPPNAGRADESDPRAAAGRRSYYHRFHELLLAERAHVVSIHGIAPEHALEHDAVLSFGAELDAASHAPSWSADLFRLLENANLRLGTFDGSAAHVPFEGASDVGLAYARRFADNQMLLLWLTAALRERWAGSGDDPRSERRAEHAAAPVRETDVAERALSLARCTARDAGERPVPRAGDCAAPATQGCALERAADGFREYTQSQNPYSLRASLAPGDGCHRELLRDTGSGRLWALVASTEEGWLVPLSGAPGSPALVAPRELRAAVALGISSLRFEL